ncbi:MULTISPECIES: polymer-forming cytoskeletal protein [Sutcliffiella]|uniref:Polymer-forming cytoskeletal protein n=1 Tax=Sutcliffiella cohnii TaxID=33932 RepID=A0A223KQD0_9BACI|nr:MULTISPECIES: polymer-forming cytoskeletal protein [Sutcliffiella]AST91564.1 hypothetical protein BC6307_09850 [Sutcliffiella cohnii]MED4014863.1 polymer-forming cytoskeletal protein [Sutcliffiella cohnii]WBL17395.1 polymer-forming cytoskeletal protein [Sutcliffiella sp. NC1]
MEEQKVLQDLKINGSMVVSGGSFNEVSINGKGTINGDVQCKEFKINGACDVNGKLKAETGVIRGNTNVEEDLYIGDFSVYGNATLQGNLYTSLFNVKGSCSVEKSINAEVIKPYGRLKVGDSCRADNFIARGVFDINDTLDSKIIDVTINGGKCSANVIKGEQVSVKLKGEEGFLKVLKSLFSFGDDRGTLKANEIIGNDIQLAATKAKLVKGDRITLNDGCDIELVEYTESLEIVGKARVIESKKV